jgi:hypothetical protein
MYRRPLQTIIVLLTAFLLLPGQVTGTVLCIGEDGHIALEIAKNGRCDTLSMPASSHEQITKTLPGTDHCGPCVDVSLSAGPLNDQQLLSAPHSLPKGEAPVLAMIASIIPVSTASRHIDFAVQPLPLANPLVALRTVILLL